jgi:Domain of unknown function (DUF4499)
VQAKAPQINHFEIPFQIWTTGSLMLLLIYCTYVPPTSQNDFWWLARTIRSIEFLDALILPSWVFLAIAHISEGAYAATLARKHHMPWHIGVCASLSLTIMPHDRP